VTARLTGVTTLAKTLRLPVDDVRGAAVDLARHWGFERVIGNYGAKDGMRLTQAAVVAIRQNFGIGGGL
jgi:hypothetical protein